MRDTHPRPPPHAPLGLGRAFSQRQRPAICAGVPGLFWLVLLAFPPAFSLARDRRSGLASQRRTRSVSSLSLCVLCLRLLSCKKEGHGCRLHPTIQRYGPTRRAQLSDPRLRNHGQPDADMLQVRQSKVICRGRALRCAAAVGHMTVSRRALRCKYRHVSAQVWVQSYIR